MPFQAQRQRANTPSQAATCRGPRVARAKHKCKRSDGHGRAPRSQQLWTQSSARGLRRRVLRRHRPPCRGPRRRRCSSEFLFRLGASCECLSVLASLPRRSGMCRPCKWFALDSSACRRKGSDLQRLRPDESAQRGPIMNCGRPRLQSVPAGGTEAPV